MTEIKSNRIAGPAVNRDIVANAGRSILGILSACLPRRLRIALGVGISRTALVYTERCWAGRFQVQMSRDGCRQKLLENSWCQRSVLYLPEAKLSLLQRTRQSQWNVRTYPAVRDAGFVPSHEAA